MSRNEKPCFCIWKHCFLLLLLARRQTGMNGMAESERPCANRRSPDLKGIQDDRGLVTSAPRQTAAGGPFKRIPAPNFAPVPCWSWFWTQNFNGESNKFSYRDAPGPGPTRAEKYRPGAPSRVMSRPTSSRNDS